MSTPGDYVFASGSTSGTDLNGSHVSDVGGGAIRTGDLFDLSTDSVSYFSVLWHESGSGGAGNLEIAFMDDASFSRSIFSLRTTSSVMTLNTNNGASTGQTAAFTAGQDYLLVGKVVSTAAGDDTVSFSIFQNGTAIGSEPTTWAMEANVDATDVNRVINRLYFVGSGNVDKFDEVRFGESFFDVTGVAEPTPPAAETISYSFETIRINSPLDDETPNDSLPDPDDYDLVLPAFKGGAAAAIAYGAGRNGGNAFFPGGAAPNDGYAVLPGSANDTALDGAEALTILGWYKSSSLAPNGRIVDTRPLSRLRGKGLLPHPRRAVVPACCGRRDRQEQTTPIP